jgi:hypothetical protein
MFIYLKKYHATRARELRGRDFRPPILYLRSFGDDEQFKARRGRGIYFDSGKTFEEVIVGELKRHGPVIAIGRPGEKIPPLGAARAYVDDESWQAEVSKLARDSRLVVLMLGGTAGVAWEFCRLVELDAHHKLVLVMPPVGEEELNRRWDSFCITVENRQRLSIPRGVVPNAILATFGADWSVEIIKSKQVHRGAKAMRFMWSPTRRSSGEFSECEPHTPFRSKIRSALSLKSSAPGLRGKSDWDISFVQTRQPTPMSALG